MQKVSPKNSNSTVSQFSKLVQTSYRQYYNNSQNRIIKFTSV